VHTQPLVSIQDRPFLCSPSSVRASYGYMTLAKEWKDGVLSIIMRGMSKNFKELG